MLKHLTENPPAKCTTAYDDWVASDYDVMTWLLNNMDEKDSASVIFLKSVKEICDTLKERCILMSRIFLKLLIC